LMSHMNGTDDLILIDTIICQPAADVNRTMKEVRDLARILAEVDPSTFGLLKCLGVVKVPGKILVSEPAITSSEDQDHSLPSESTKVFKFVFAISPTLSNPRSLRAVLLDSASYSLNERLDLAKKLTSSILFVHSVQFVHKNIRPETILVFQNEHSEIGAPFLVGFEKFRLADGQTYRAGDELWDQNLYRHPSRQGTLPEEEYRMQHDIYSLGVVLLELGLWKSFLYYPLRYGALSFVDPLTRTPLPNSAFEILTPDDDRNSHQRALANKHTLETLAERELPLRMGRQYRDIVLLCLRCLDAGNDSDAEGQGFGINAGMDGAEREGRWMDDDGVVIGVRFIENVLEKIQEISI